MCHHHHPPATTHKKEEKWIGLCLAESVTCSRLVASTLQHTNLYSHVGWWRERRERKSLPLGPIRPQGAMSHGAKKAMPAASGSSGLEDEHYKLPRLEVGCVCYRFHFIKASCQHKTWWAAVGYFI